MSDENYTAGGTGGDDRPDVTVYAQRYGIAYRKYLPTLADLIDRRSIVRMKAIFMLDHHEDYIREAADIDHDVQLILKQLPPPPVEVWNAVQMNQLANRYIWENETRIRDGSSTEPDDVVLRRLKATHSINGVRNTSKNIIDAWAGGRQDYKIDCFAADLPPEFGNWNGV